MEEVYNGLWMNSHPL